MTAQHLSQMSLAELDLDAPACVHFVDAHVAATKMCNAAFRSSTGDLSGQPRVSDRNVEVLHRRYAELAYLEMCRGEPACKWWRFPGIDMAPYTYTPDNQPVTR